MKKVNKSSHSNLIDLCKLLFTFSVVLMHFESSYFTSPAKIFECGYLAVDFFFVLSGYLLYRSYKSGKYDNAMEFTKSRIKHFAPYVLTVIAMLTVYDLYGLVRDGVTLSAIVATEIQRILYTISDALFLQMFIPAQFVNFPMWYISVLLIVGMVYYMYLERRTYVQTGGVLILSLIVLGALKVIYGQLDVHIATTDIFYMPAGVLRGFAEMGIGLFCAEQSEGIRHNSIKWSILEIIILIMMLVCMVKYPHTSLDFIFVILCAAFIVLAFSDEYMNDRFNYLPKTVGVLSTNIYFCHMFCISLWKYLMGPLNFITHGRESISMMMIIILSCIVALLLEMFVNKIMKYVRMRNEKVINAGN